jgi:4-hydroxy-3-polyprenylbenzoate decarboxylase
MSHPYVVAVTGASGAVYAQRLLQVLIASGRDVHLCISPAGKSVIKQELDLDISLSQFEIGQFLPATMAPLPPADAQAASDIPGQITYHHHGDFFAPIASGSALTSGMVICPCSGGTLSGVVTGASNNLIHRAADVHLKERRPLILVPRETPLSLVQIENMRKACEQGATVLPAMPGWYHGVKSLQDLIDFVVARTLDQLGVPHQLMKRWGSE